MGVAAGHDATTAAEVVDLWSSTSKVAGATFVNLQPDRAKQPKLKTASGFIAGRCTFLSTVFNYASNAGTDKKPAISVTMFENAGIGVGKTITYGQLVGSLDKDGDLRSLLAEGFRSTQAVAEDTPAMYATVTTAYPSMVGCFASALDLEADCYRLDHVLKLGVKHRAIPRRAPQKPASGRVAPQPVTSQLFYCSRHNCRKHYIKEAALKEHMAKCRGGRADVVRVATGVAAIDAAAGLVNTLHGTMPTVRTLRQPSTSTLPTMGFGRNLGRAAPQHFSEAEIAQLMQWYHEGAAKKIVKMKGKNAAEKLIEMKLHDLGDEDPTQFQNRYALRISSWFGAYHRAVTKSHERTERVGRVEETAEALLMLDAATAKKPKGPPRKKSKAAGASGIDVPAGPAAATTAVAVIGLTAVATVKKRKSRPGKQKPIASDRDAAGAVELPSDALPCPNGADDGMMATDAPREAPNHVKKPKKKKAKTTGAEGGGATGVPVPPSAALGVPDVTASMLPAQVPTSRTGRRGAGQNRNHGRLPTSTASAARPTPRMSAYDEIRAIEAAARRGT